MTLGVFMLGLFAIVFAFLVGVAVAHYISEAVRFVWFSIDDFIREYRAEQRPYDWNESGI